MQNTDTLPKAAAHTTEAARAADRAAAEDFANLLRDLLGLTPDMPRFHQGRDQHRRADRFIRLARERVRDQVPLDGDDIIAAGYSAACAWHRFIYLERATGAALEYVQNLSPWAFCRFLGDLVVARVKTGRAQDRYFCELATRVTTAARIRSEAAPVERLAQQHTEILHLTDQPHLSDRWETIAPYVVWITYRLEAGATKPTWEAAVSGYRVLDNGVVDMDARSITLRSGTDQLAPDSGDMTMELASSAVAAVIALLATVLGFRLQERSAARRDGLAQQAQQRAELRQVFVRFLARLAAMRRLQNERSILAEAGASEAERAAAKQAALEARTAVGEALTELQLMTDDPRVLELAGRVVDVTFTLHEAPDRADRDRRGDLARAAHNTFVAAAGRLVRA